MKAMKTTTYRTSDMGLASFLIARGYRNVTVDRRDMRRHEFMFEGIDRAEELARQYLSGEATVNALAFFQGTREAKRLLFDHGDRY